MVYLRTQRPCDKVVNKMIERIHLKGPFGDETSLFDIKFTEEMTVEEFIKIAVAENLNEWGEFKYGWQSPIIAEYNRGEISYTEEYERVKNRIVNKATANGGWSLMTYFLSIV